MIKHILLLLFLFCSIPAMSQETDPVNIGVSSDSIYKAREESMPQKAYKLTPYWKKHNVFKTCAWSAFGVGLCGTVVGYIGAIVNGYTNAHWKEEKGTWEFIIASGTVVTCSSIPLFVLSHKYKKKAKKTAKVSVAYSSINMVSPDGMRRSDPSVGVLINF